MCKDFEPKNSPNEHSEVIQKLKANLKAILKENGHRSDHPDVVKAVEELSSLWMKSQENQPTASSKENQSITHSPLNLGTWNILSKSMFPGRIENEDEPDKCQYTLGRLSFNLFQPKDLVCTLNHVTNIMEAMETPEDADTDENSNKMTYNVIQDLTISTDKGDLKAELHVDGWCAPQSDKDTRLTVAFTAGQFKKGKGVDDDTELKEKWDEIFGGAYTKAAKERGYLESIILWVLKFAFKMEMPSDESMKYEMKRTMHGYIDILYLDDDFRVTRGNRGSIVIVEKLKE